MRRQTRRHHGRRAAQFLKGLTTGTVAIGALSQAGMRSGDSAAQNPRRDQYDDGLPFLRRRLRPGRVFARPAR